MKLRPGDLVKPATSMGADLYMNPPLSGFLDRCGWLNVGQLAIVISLHRRDGSSVYVIGPNCAGWTFGASLQKIELVVTMETVSGSHE